jgi:thioredoxin reductase (NADPH)
LLPVLDPSQIDMAKRFASGRAHDFAPGEIVYDVGERNVPAWLVLKGSIDVVRRDGLNHEAAITKRNLRPIFRPPCAFGSMGLAN